LTLTNLLQKIYEEREKKTVAEELRGKGEGNGGENRRCQMG
jgi:hypothetical protein